MLNVQSYGLTQVENSPRTAGGRLPLVSFIVVNYNYGRYLRQCVDSIFAQTYPAVECVVIDNNSTDESREVISDLKAKYANLEVVFEDQNLGQSAACLDGYSKTRGHYVVFTDADDYYLETFAETHILVHLSLRDAPGFSSSDMLQQVNGEIVLGTIFHGGAKLGDSALPPLKPNTPRDFSSALQQDCPFAIDLNSVPLRSVFPRELAWVWAPTSGSMYRRDALEMFIRTPKLRTLRCSTDAFFNFAINAFSGSVLIERPLAIYRIHGSNQFTKHPALDGIRNFQTETELGAEVAAAALDYIMANFAVFYHRAWTPKALFDAIHTLHRKARQRHSSAFDAVLIRAAQIFWRFRRRLPS